MNRDRSYYRRQRARHISKRRAICHFFRSHPMIYDKRVGLQAGFFYNVDRNSEEMDSICFGSDEFMEKYRSEVTEDEFSEIQHDRAVMQAIMRYKNGEQNENDQGPTPEQRNESYGLSMVEACTLQPSLLETMK